MSPIQQMLLGVGAAEKTYVDDAFLTHLYGYSSSATITTNIDLTENGGMLWIKNRTNDKNHCLADTVTGSDKLLIPNQSTAQEDGPTGRITNITSTGFTLGTDDEVKSASHGYTSWNFVRTPGFFDIVTYTGNGSGRNISHSLGCVPGMILVKCLSHSAQWAVYHRGTSSMPEGDGMALNSDDPMSDFTGTDDWWDGNNRQPTATTFGVGTNTRTNQNTRTYVAYLFAGGESTAATARSVDFDGNDNLKTAGDNSFKFGTGDWTIEGWYKWDSLTSPHSDQFIFDQRNTDNGHYASLHKDGTTLKVYIDSANRIIGTTVIETGQWYHICLVRSSGVIKLYVNGVQEGSDYSNSSDFDGDRIFIAYSERIGTNYSFNGFISNFRVTKSAVYTSSFRPPTKPLTNITNTVLLCCNNASVTGSTVTTGALSSSGNPTASSDSPFDDPAAFKFGGNKEGVIKCGYYIGNGSSTGPEINLGWEPQWVMIRNIEGNGKDWNVFDSMRGLTTNAGDDLNLIVNSNKPEDYDNSAIDALDLTPTGFKIVTSDSEYNANNSRILYMAIRRPDGYVGKPPELGTGVFAMDRGSGSSTMPTFDSNFVVDWAFPRKFAQTDNWGQYTRLTGDKFLRLNTNDNGGTYYGGKWDSNVGFGASSFWDSARQGWMWKRHAGFDVVTFQGSGSARQIPHSMNAIPEFIIFKNRETANNQWYIYNKGLNGGTNPEDYYVKLGASGDAAEAGDSGGSLFNSTAPTSTHFSVGTSSAINESGKGSLAILFTSVDGISKVGSYTGTGSIASGPNNAQTTGFSPRFLMFKRVDDTGGWYIFDTLRGLSSSGIPAGYDPYLLLNSTAAQGGTTNNPLNVSSTGFSFHSSNATATININNAKYIYYAHA